MGVEGSSQRLGDSLRTRDTYDSGDPRDNIKGTSDTTAKERAEAREKNGVFADEERKAAAQKKVAEKNKPSNSANETLAATGDSGYREKLEYGKSV